MDDDRYPVDPHNAISGLCPVDKPLRARHPELPTLRHTYLAATAPTPVVLDSAALFGPQLDDVAAASNSDEVKTMEDMRRVYLRMRDLFIRVNTICDEVQTIHAYILLCLVEANLRSTVAVKYRRFCILLKQKVR